MPKAGRNKPSDKGRAAESLELMEVGSMEFWRTLARRLSPKLTDEWDIAELATAMEEINKHLGASYPGISKVIGKAVDKSAGVSIGLSIDRTEQPPEIMVKVSYSEKHSVSARVRVADPAQSELPLMAGSKDGEGEVPESKPPGE